MFVLATNVLLLCVSWKRKMLQFWRIWVSWFWFLNEQVNKCTFEISRLTTNIFIYSFYLFILMSIQIAPVDKTLPLNWSSPLPRLEISSLKQDYRHPPWNLYNFQGPRNMIIIFKFIPSTVFQPLKLAGLES